AELLRLEAIHLHRKFGRANDIGQIDELPAFHLRAVAEVRIFGERIVLPSAGVANHRLPENTGGAVEIEKGPGGVARTMLEDEVGVQKQGLDFGEQVEIAVGIAPAG